MRSRTWALAAALVLAACGKGVDDLELPAEPLAVVRGRLDLAAALSAAGGHPLRAALVWGASPEYLDACFAFGDAAVQRACPDPLGFVPGSVESEVALAPDGDGSFELPVFRLPDARVAVGTAAARMSWGSVIVAADSDGNGALNLLSRVAGEEQGPQLADRTVAASFLTLDAPQHRVGFREGGWNEGSCFYPAPGCAAPVAGFSTLATPGIAGIAITEAAPLDCRDVFVPAPGECGLGSLEEPVALAPVSSEEAKGLACRSLDRAAVRQPPDHRPTGSTEDGAAAVTDFCLGTHTFVTIEEGDCPRITFWPLKGCRDNLRCEPPDWNQEQRPPGWWPCGS